jgi:hypothetical protein
MTYEKEEGGEESEFVHFEEEELGADPEEIVEEEVYFTLEDGLRRDILTGKRKRKLKNLDGNVTKQGITDDLEAMKRIGLGGVGRRVPGAVKHAHRQLTAPAQRAAVRMRMRRSVQPPLQPQRPVSPALRSLRHRRGKSVPAWIPPLVV